MDMILVLPQSDTEDTILALSKHGSSAESSLASAIDRIFAARKQTREERLTRLMSELHESGDIPLQVIGQLLGSQRFLEYYKEDVKVSIKYCRTQDEVQGCRIKVRGN